MPDIMNLNEEEPIQPFDLTSFLKANGLNSGQLEPYNYEHYRSINDKLTKRMYEHLRLNKNLWRVRCGKHCKIEWTNEVLEPVWWLDIPQNNDLKYSPYEPSK